MVNSTPCASFLISSQGQTRKTMGTLINSSSLELDTVENQKQRLFPNGPCLQTICQVFLLVRQMQIKDTVYMISLQMSEKI